MLEQADKVRNTAYGLDWKGDTQNACNGRADRELAQDRRVAAGYEALAKAYENGKNSMQPMIESLKTQGKGFEDDNFDVSEDWKVTDKFNYDVGKTVMMMLGFTEDEAQAEMDKLRKERGNEAATGTTNLQKLADELGVADTNTKNAITAAKNDIGASAPMRTGLVGGPQATADGKAIVDGKATPEQIARARAALTGWTPEQLAALAEGKPADMPQGQYDYLKSLMESMNGKSVQDINAAAAKYGLQGAMGDGIRMMGNPNVQTALGSHGGLDTLPDKVHGLLTNDIHPGTRVLMVPLSEFSALNGMLDQSNKGLAKGSDVDRALLSQSAKISGAMNKGVDVIDMAQKNGHSADGWTPNNEVNKVVNGMITNANIDHQAVTDFLAAADNEKHSDPANGASVARMSHATDGHFGGNQAFLDLATHKFEAGQTAVRDMFGWEGDGATKPGLEGHNAALSASATAHLLADNADKLGAEAGDHALGRVNPELVQTMTKNLIPYMGNLDGVQVPGIDPVVGKFATTHDLANMIRVLDTDPASAAAVNRAAAGWENYFAHEYGRTGSQDLAVAAGNIIQAVNEGDTAHLNALRADHRWEDIQNFGKEGAAWDTGKALVSTGVKSIPVVGDWIAKGVDLANPAAKIGVLGVALDPSKMSDDQWQQALRAAQTDFQHSVDGRYREYAMLDGYLESHQGDLSQFRNVTVSSSPTPVNFVDENGNVDWNTMNQYHNDFSRMFNRLPLGDWNSSINGFEKGLEEPTIDPKILTPPTSSAGLPPTAEAPHK
ncbi:TPR repeat region-containing protein [Mycobacteroides abscessus]|uniref:TPR repeat region-containing protein n=1 Tax=Mycobacteroides abscessus TaxID=36809 RepID=UPI00104261E2|nr:hypothetical protein [Mycobacteroides abscessus]